MCELIILQFWGPHSFALQRTISCILWKMLKFDETKNTVYLFLYKIIVEGRWRFLDLLSQTQQLKPGEAMASCSCDSPARLWRRNSSVMVLTSGSLLAPRSPALSHQSSQTQATCHSCLQSKSASQVTPLVPSFPFSLPLILTSSIISPPLILSFSYCFS